MNWNMWIRQIHRWLSIVFTLSVIANGIAVLEGKYSSRMSLSAVGLVALLLFSGLYLFVLPYVARWRSRRRLAVSH